MADYVGINSLGKAVSGIWAADSLIPEGQTLVELTGEADIGWTFDGTSWVAPLVSIQALRSERDQLLSDTDRYALTDVTMTPAMTAYRQSLRDLPEGYTPRAYPDYPVKP